MKVIIAPPKAHTRHGAEMALPAGGGARRTITAAANAPNPTPIKIGPCVETLIQRPTPPSNPATKNQRRTPAVTAATPSARKTSMLFASTRRLTNTRATAKPRESGRPGVNSAPNGKSATSPSAKSTEAQRPNCQATKTVPPISNSPCSNGSTQRAVCSTESPMGCPVKTWSNQATLPNHQRYGEEEFTSRPSGALS